MPGLGNGEVTEVKRTPRMMVPVEEPLRCDCGGGVPALLEECERVWTEYARGKTVGY